MAIDTIFRFWRRHNSIYDVIFLRSVYLLNSWVALYMFSMYSELDFQTKCFLSILILSYLIIFLLFLSYLILFQIHSNGYVTFTEVATTPFCGDEVTVPIVIGLYADLLPASSSGKVFFRWVCNGLIHYWSANVAILTKFSSLKVVILTISGAPGDKYFINIMTTFRFESK